MILIKVICFGTKPIMSFYLPILIEHVHRS